MGGLFFVFYLWFYVVVVIMILFEGFWLGFDVDVVVVNVGVRVKVFGWVWWSIDLILIFWFFMGVGVVLLVGIVLFGGFEVVVVDLMLEVLVGEIFVGFDFEMMVVGVELCDECGMVGLYFDEEE